MGPDAGPARGRAAGAPRAPRPLLVRGARDRRRTSATARTRHGICCARPAGLESPGARRAGDPRPASARAPQRRRGGRNGPGARAARGARGARGPARAGRDRAGDGRGVTHLDGRRPRPRAGGRPRRAAGPRHRAHPHRTRGRRAPARRRVERHHVPGNPRAAAGAVDLRRRRRVHAAASAAISREALQEAAGERTRHAAARRGPLGAARRRSGRAPPPGVLLYDVDDVAAAGRHALGARRAHVPAAEAIVEEELSGFEAWHATRALVPTIKALREHQRRSGRRGARRRAGRSRRAARDAAAARADGPASCGGRLGRGRAVGRRRRASCSTSATTRRGWARPCPAGVGLALPEVGGYRGSRGWPHRTEARAVGGYA